MQSLSGSSISKAIISAAFLVVLVVLVRLVWLFAVTYIPRALHPKIREHYPAPSWQQVLLVGWTGLRGVDSLAVALAMPFFIASGAPFPNRDMIFFLTFSVIFGTLVVQGLSLAPLIRWLKLEDDHTTEKEERLARLEANRAALKQVCLIVHSRKIDANAQQRIKLEYEDRVRQLESDSPDSPLQPGMYSSDYETLTQEALDAERRVIVKLRNDRVINDEVLRRIQWDIDLAEARLKHQEEDDE